LLTLLDDATRLARACFGRAPKKRDGASARKLGARPKKPQNLGLARLTMTDLQSNMCHAKNHRLLWTPGKQRAVANTPPESCGSMKSSARSIRALNRFQASCSNWKCSAWGTSRGMALRVIVKENRAEVNFELVEQLTELEHRDWRHFGRLRHQREKKYRNPQDVLLEADHLRQHLKKRRAQRPGLRNKPAARRVLRRREPSVMVWKPQLNLRTIGSMRRMPLPAKGN